MRVLNQITLLQDSEIAVTRLPSDAYTLRYSYARSADSRKNGEPGQDYLPIREESGRISFALCDGVTQSFFGDLAARLLGEALVEWLWKQDAGVVYESRLSAELKTALQGLTTSACKEVASYPLPEDIAPMHRSVLEEKRGLGSQSTFIAGLMDKASQRLLLAWMGDSRLRLWGKKHEEITSELGNSFLTEERWSTSQGTVGELHVHIRPLSQVTCLSAYSDGLAILDRTPVYIVSDRAIQEAIIAAGESPASDDISFLQVWMEGGPPDDHPLPAPQVNMTKVGDQFVLTWEPVQKAMGYEVRYSNGRIRRQKVEQEYWSVPEVWEITPGSTVQVRAWQGYEPGLWSELVELSPAEELPVVSIGKPEEEHQPVQVLESGYEDLTLPTSVIDGSGEPTSRRERLNRLFLIIAYVVLIIVCLTCGLFYLWVR